MLIFQNTSGKINRIIRVLLFFISFVPFHTIVYADIKQDTAEEYRLQGYAEQQKGNFNDALSYYIKAISLGLENAVVLNDMGVLSEQLGQRARAEQYYRKAMDVDPQYLPGYTNLAYLYKNQGDLDKAFKFFIQRYEMADPGDLWAEKVKEEILRIRPEYKQRIVFLEAQRLNQELTTKAHEEFYNRVQTANEHYKKGEGFLEKRRYQKSITEFDLALQLTPGNPKVIEARKKAVLELSKENIKQGSERAVRMLNIGDTISARNEVQKILTTIPNKPMLISR